MRVKTHFVTTSSYDEFTYLITEKFNYYEVYQA